MRLADYRREDPVFFVPLGPAASLCGETCGEGVRGRVGPEEGVCERLERPDRVEAEEGVWGVWATTTSLPFACFLLLYHSNSPELESLP